MFLTNKLPTVRTKLKIDVDDLRAHNPNIIYVRGHGQGEPRPRRRPRLVRLALVLVPRRHRARASSSTTTFRRHPAPAFGDSIGAMTIAGGIMGALFHRERTGEATTVDVSLLGTGLWSLGGTMALSLQLQRGWTSADRRVDRPAIRSCPTTGPRTIAGSRCAACRPGSTGQRRAR